MKRHFVYGLVLAVVVLAGAVVPLLPLGPVERLREVVFDTFQRLSPRGFDPDLPVRIVAIDESSLSRIGQWPWPRDVIARLTKRLAEAGAAAIAYDVVFGEPDQSSPDLLVRRLPDSPERQALEAVLARSATSHDETFAAVGKEAPLILGFIGSEGGVAVPSKAGFAIAGDDPTAFLPRFKGAVLPIAPLLEAAPGLGAVNWLPDGDSVIRKVPTAIVAGGKIGPSLSLEALRVAQGAGTFVIRSSNASGETAFGQNTGINAVKVGDLTTPTDSSGEIRLWARRAAPASWVPAADVLEGKMAPDAVSGRIVFVGAVAIGLGDRRTTPVEEAIPGVEIHAQTVEQILTHVTLTRPDWMTGFEAALILVGGLALAIFLRLMRNRPNIGTLASLILPATTILVSWFLFKREGLLLDPIMPSLVFLAVTLTATAYHFGEAEQRRVEVRGIFGRFVTPAVVERLVEEPERITLGGEIRPLTILFSDVRDFTSLSESRSPEGVVSLIRSVHTTASRAVLDHHGTIDKYIGDGMMAFWNAPLEDPSHALNACLAALDITRAIRTLADPPVRLGIGIHTGEACVGNLGSEQRLEYSALGDAVNLSSRIEGLTKLYGVEILVTDATAHAAERLTFLEVDRVRVKGRQGATTLYALHGDRTDESFLRLERLHLAFLDAYRRGDPSETSAALEEAKEAYGTRYAGLYRLYRARVAEMAPAAPDWDGVTTLDHK